jgi:hypothetical protein
VTETVGAFDSFSRQTRGILMVWIIGLFTMSALIWLLAVMMSAESESERRRRFGLSSSAECGDGGNRSKSRQAA